MKLEVVEAVAATSSSLEGLSLEPEHRSYYKNAESFFLPVGDVHSRKKTQQVERHLCVGHTYLPVIVTYEQTEERIIIDNKKHRQFLLSEVRPNHNSEQFANAAQEIEALIESRKAQIAKIGGKQIVRNLDAIATLEEEEWIRRTFQTQFTRNEQTEPASRNGMGSYEMLRPFFHPTHAINIRDIAILEQLLIPGKNRNKQKSLLTRYIEKRYFNEYPPEQAKYEAILAAYGALSFLLENNISIEQAENFFHDVVFTAKNLWLDLSELSEQEFTYLFSRRSDPTTGAEIALLDRTVMSTRMVWANIQKMHNDYYYPFLIWLGIKEVQAYVNALGLSADATVLRSLIRQCSFTLLKKSIEPTDNNHLRRMGETLTILATAVKPFMRNK